MTCTDPKTSLRLQSADVLDATAWQAHLDACPDCRTFFGAVGQSAAGDPLVTHPSASALWAFDEEPASLAPDIWEWISSHLASCALCAGALAQVPRLALRPLPVWLRPWPLTAAAGWILALILAVRGGKGTLEPTDMVLDAHSLVLSTTRGSEIPSAPPNARILRLHLILPEDVEPGQRLRLRLADSNGRVIFERDQTVTERDDREWPVLTLDRAALPAGSFRLHVGTPSGQDAIFDLNLN
jgi:hypothetical protein